MADKQITVSVPEERVAEFYTWFGHFLAAEPGQFLAAEPGRQRGWRGPRGSRRHGEPEPWSPEDAKQARWLYRKLAPPARELFDLLMEEPGEPFSGDEIARRLGLEKGAHGVAGILAWPGRYSRHLNRLLPIETAGRPDGGTDYFMETAVAGLFREARGG
jgi:hypothetical protein